MNSSEKEPLLIIKERFIIETKDLTIKNGATLTITMFGKREILPHFLLFLPAIFMQVHLMNSSEKEPL
ncbi:hypothetical protein, partial [Chryseobacterium sp. CH1]|uniref:hypothetical protein n=1 Tax=Chryseobacterium sp. CH1 TaxID=713551 RepID=UPI001E5E35C5